MKKLLPIFISSMLFNGQTHEILSRTTPFLIPKQGVSPSMTQIYCVATTDIPKLGSNNTTLLAGQTYPEPQYLEAQYVPGQVFNGTQIVEYSAGLTPEQVCRNIHPNLEVQFVGVQPLAQLPNVTVTTTGQIRR